MRTRNGKEDQYQPKSIHVGLSHKSTSFSAWFTEDLHGIIKGLLHDQTKRLSIKCNVFILEIAQRSYEKAYRAFSAIWTVLEVDVALVRHPLVAVKYISGEADMVQNFELGGRRRDSARRFVIGIGPLGG
jgi:hypothetical protein